MDTTPSKQNRKLAAILFADIAGYTALLKMDEQTASILLRRFQKDMENKIPEFNGQIINFYGDGALSTFKSAVETVECAVAMKRSFQEDKASTSLTVIRWNGNFRKLNFRLSLLTPMKMLLN